MKRAYATIEIKATDGAAGEKRTFTGIASTPTTDRMGDIVEPKGAIFRLPIPLLWQHRSGEPIGWITAAKVTDKGIEIAGEVADVPEEGKLKERLLEAWQSLKYKLVRGLSIGFDPIEHTQIDGTWGQRFTKWEWLELSAVTIPANGDCSIDAIKSADQAIRRAASGARPVVRLDPAGSTSKSLPGASGNKSPRRPGAVYLN
jgi:HK97 family phage prohead protease